MIGNPTMQSDSVGATVGKFERCGSNDVQFSERQGASFEEDPKKPGPSDASDRKRPSDAIELFASSVACNSGESNLRTREGSTSEHADPLMNSARSAPFSTNRAPHLRVTPKQGHQKPGMSGH